MSGLGGCWHTANLLWGVDGRIAGVLFPLSAIIWVALLVGYTLKWVARREFALAEARHPVQCCFIAVIAVSTMLVAIWIYGWAPGLGAFLVGAGVIGQLAFSVFRSGGLMRGGRSTEDTTAVMYLPTVAGNFVSAIALSAIGELE